MNDKFFTAKLNKQPQMPNLPRNRFHKNLLKHMYNMSLILSTKLKYIKKVHSIVYWFVQHEMKSELRAAVLMDTVAGQVQRVHLTHDTISGLKQNRKIQGSFQMYYCSGNKIVENLRRHRVRYQ